jgi:hypothetical protein
MQVVVILKETDYIDSERTEVYGVYVNLKQFYDEARAKGYKYDELHKRFYGTDSQGNFIWFEEEVKELNGYQPPHIPEEVWEDE